MEHVDDVTEYGMVTENDALLNEYAFTGTSCCAAELIFFFSFFFFFGWQGVLSFALRVLY